MHPVLRNIIAVVAGVFGGGFLNMGIIMISGKLIPPPEGANLTTMEGLKAAMSLMGPQHFVMPFLAHALGTLLGAFIAGKIASKNKMRFSMGIGIWFLIGGTINIFMLPSPAWFTVLDLVCAYLPMAWIGGKITLRPSNKK